MLGISKNIFWNAPLQSYIIGRTAFVFYQLKGQHFFFKILIYFMSFLIGSGDWLLKDTQFFSSFTSVQRFCQLRSSKWMGILPTLVTLKGQVDLIWELWPKTKKYAIYYKIQVETQAINIRQTTLQ